MHLLRAGELGPPEQTALNQHLSECQNCRDEYAELQLDWVQLMGELGQEPEAPDPDQLTQRILIEIDKKQVRTVDQGSPVYDSLQNLLIKPQLRMTLQLASLVFLAIFFVEQFQVTHSVRSLELELKRQSTNANQARVSILPLRVKQQLLVSAREQLEKRGLPAERIERYLQKIDHRILQNELNLSTNNRRGWGARWLVQRLEPAQTDASVTQGENP